MPAHSLVASCVCVWEWSEVDRLWRLAQVCDGKTASSVLAYGFNTHTNATVTKLMLHHCNVERVTNRGRVERTERINHKWSKECGDVDLSNIFRYLFSSSSSSVAVADTARSARIAKSFRKSLARRSILLLGLSPRTFKWFLLVLFFFSMRNYNWTKFNCPTETVCVLTDTIVAVYRSRLLCCRYDSL